MGMHTPLQLLYCMLALVIMALATSTWYASRTRLGPTYSIQASCLYSCVA